MPPVHSVTFCPVISAWMPPAYVPSARWTAKKPRTSAQSALERARLVAVRGLDRRCRASGRGLHTTGCPSRFTRADELGQAVLDLVVAVARDEREAARRALTGSAVSSRRSSASGVEAGGRTSCRSGCRCRAGTRHAPSPRSACGRRSTACGRWCRTGRRSGESCAGQRLLIGEQQRFVAGVEVGALSCGDACRRRSRRRP